MMLQVFSVHDKAVNAYLQPFYCRSKGEAVRSFTEACNDEKSNFHKHSMDYVLVYVGEFDDSSCTFRVADPVRIISATECIIDSPFTSETELPAKPANGSKRLPM